jgi:hypothetical protein
MQHAFNQLLQFLQQGIAAIFHFVQLIWTWSVGQISALLAVPWQQWPLWKEILLALVLVAVICFVSSGNRTFRRRRADPHRIRSFT